MAITNGQRDLINLHPLPYTLAKGSGVALGDIIQALQEGLAGGSGFNAGAISSTAGPNGALRFGTVTGTIATAGTAVNTGAVGAGITPVTQWVSTGPEGAAIVSYSGGADGTFSVNAAATGTVTVTFIY